MYFHHPPFPYDPLPRPSRSHTYTSSFSPPPRPPLWPRGIWFDWARDKRDVSACGTEQTHLSFLPFFSPAMTPLPLTDSFLLSSPTPISSPDLLTSFSSLCRLGTIKSRKAFRLVAERKRERDVVIFAGDGEGRGEGERMGFRCY